MPTAFSFLDTPDTYFDVIDQRIPDHGEDVPRMRKNKILIDADMNQPELQLLQIFTQDQYRTDLLRDHPAQRATTVSAKAISRPCSKRIGTRPAEARSTVRHG